MSTCQGAPAPHEDCPHGKACDWNDGPAAALSRAALRTALREPVQPGLSRRERRAAERQARRS